MTDVVLMADPAVGRIPVVDSGEPLVQLAAGPRIRFDQRLADPSGDWRWLRSGVAERLSTAADSLPPDLQLLFVEGFRPPRLQIEYFTSYRDELTERWPDLPPAEVHALASRYISPPDIAPHSAGAAVDVTLCTAAGVELDLGTALNATPEESQGACYTASELVSPTARRNREILSAALLAAGFVNYPTEWWHWSFGDRYWAMTLGRASARYPPAHR